MSAPKVRTLRLTQAQVFSVHIKNWLAPFCETIVVAGSVRRRMQHCNDIDLVVVPKFTEVRDLLGNVDERRNLLRCELEAYVGSRSGVPLSGVAAWRNESNTPPAIGATIFYLSLPKCDLDVFCATQETLGTVVLCRTGSVEHNIWLCERAKAMGGHWDPPRGLRLAGKTYARTEEEIYAALEMPWIPPENRRVEYLRKEFPFPRAPEKGGGLVLHGAAGGWE